MVQGERGKPARLLIVIQTLLTTAAVALCATHAAVLENIIAQRRLRRPHVKIPIEMKRDPADVAIDREIKGILPRVLICNL
jgi:hypothetical protein